MFDDVISRRALLRGGLAGLGGLAILGACDPTAAGATNYPVGAFVLSSDLYAAADPQRFVFVLQQGTANGIMFVSGPAATVRFRPPKGTWTKPVAAPLDRAGLSKGRGVYVASTVLSTPGIWSVEAKVAGKTVPFKIQVNDRSEVVLVGQPAVRAASPTLANPLGVNPICTRQPACPLHTVSLADVIGAGRPVAALFATPARCQSQYCGPVLDELLKVMPAYADKVTFVHVEIYQAATGTALCPTVSAWNLPSEPWLFGIDAGGTVVSRIDGAFGGTEMKKLLSALAR